MILAKRPKIAILWLFLNAEKMNLLHIARYVHS
jgi:hypothetical protein